MTAPVVLFVGTDLPLSPHAHGIFRRCGFVIREYRTLDQVRETLDGWTPAFVIVMLSRPVGQISVATLRIFLESLNTRPTPPRVVAVCPRALDDAELGACKSLGLHVLHGSGIPHRRLAQKLIDLLGGDGKSCCRAAPGRGRTGAPTFNPRRTRTP